MTAKIVLATLAALAVVATLAPPAAADPVRVCYTGVQACSFGNSDFPFMVCVGYDETVGATGVCVDHSYDRAKHADCKGVYVGTPVLERHNVECYGDSNCYHYVDSNFGLAPRHGCNGPGETPFTQLWPYLP